MSNVVSFPKSKKNIPPQTFEELVNVVQAVRKEHIDFIIEDFMNYFMVRAVEEGFDLTKDDCMKTTIFMVEAIKSALYATVKIEHKFQEIAEDLFVIEGDDDEIIDDEVEADAED